MNGLAKAFWLARQIFPASVGGATFGLLSWLIEPSLALLMLCPVALHLWSGFFYGADPRSSRWTWRSVALASMALLGALVVLAVIHVGREKLGGFIWMYGIAMLVWILAAWAIGAMALVDDWT